MTLVNPVPVFDFTVMMLDAKPLSSMGAADVAGAALGVAKAAIVGTFSEVSGLDAEMETEEYRQGGSNTAPRKFVKWGKYPNLVLKRGVTLNPDLWDWYYATLYKTADPARKNVLVMLTDRGTGISALAGGPTSFGLPVLDRLPIAVWFCRNALPEKMHGPGLNAKSSEIAIETLELAHEGLYRVGASMLPGGAGAAMDALGI
ncbi:MAG: phage tail protein [Gemmatimonadaceae bacterium]|nr:phage tail protein [Gemmatimonadaceae bacterium]NUQ92463.1 phage tail protein [Gemmatimonadaceae bacterium]NUR20753.1 phage tail protein [Gemmatimonadaceae bacterium]NUS98597.1 phage tail protein [Gemmatimonadaceae bacterium]